MLFAWQAQGFRALWCRCLKNLTLNPWEGCKFHVTEVLLCRDHFAWQLQDFVCLGSTFSWQAQYFWSIHLKIAKTYWNSDVKCLLNMSILKEVSQKCFVFDLQSFIFEGSLAEKLRFWASKLQFWRKSRRNASFLIFKASFLKEVSQKSFVLELQSFNFEGSLAEMLGFGVSKFRLLKEVSQKGFVFASKLQFWRKSRRKASFDKIIWITHQLTTNSLEPQIIWQPNHLNLKSINWQPTHLNLRSIDNQLTGIRSQLTNKINRIAHRLTCKSLESQINWEPTLESRIDWQPNHLNLKLIDNQINWISNQLTTTSLEVRINRQPKSFEAHIDWQPNHLNFKSLDNPNHLNLTSIESDINWLSNQLNSARSLPIGSLSLETSATASCGRYVISYMTLICVYVYICVDNINARIILQFDHNLKWFAGFWLLCIQYCRIYTRHVSKSLQSLWRWVALEVQPLAWSWVWSATVTLDLAALLCWWLVQIKDIRLLVGWEEWYPFLILWKICLYSYIASKRVWQKVPRCLWLLATCPKCGGLQSVLPQ